MSTVRLNSNVVAAIAEQARRIVYEAHAKPPEYPNALPGTVADEAWNLLIPKADEEIALKHIPTWGQWNDVWVYIYITNEKLNSFYDAYNFTNQNPCVMGKATVPHVPLAGYCELTNLPGLEKVTWDGGSMAITPGPDFDTAMPPSPLKDYIAEIMAIQGAILSRKEESEKAQKDMAAFLRQFPTLQKAAKEFGPAIWQFVPPDIKEVYDRPPVKRTRKVRPNDGEVEVTDESTAPVNIDYLVAKATTQMLQLNA